MLHKKERDAAGDCAHVKVCGSRQGRSTYCVLTSIFTCRECRLVVLRHFLQIHLCFNADSAERKGRGRQV